MSPPRRRADDDFDELMQFVRRQAQQPAPESMTRPILIAVVSSVLTGLLTAGGSWFWLTIQTGPQVQKQFEAFKAEQAQTNGNLSGQITDLKTTVTKRFRTVERNLGIVMKRMHIDNTAQAGDAEAAPMEQAPTWSRPHTLRPGG